MCGLRREDWDRNGKAKGKVYGRGRGKRLAEMLLVFRCGWCGRICEQIFQVSSRGQANRFRLRASKQVRDPTRSKLNSPGVGPMSPASKNLIRNRWNAGSFGARPTKSSAQRLRVKRAGWES